MNRSLTLTVNFSKGLKGAVGEKGKSGQPGKKAC